MNKALARPRKAVVKQQLKRADGSYTLITRKTDAKGVSRRSYINTNPKKAR